MTWIKSTDKFGVFYYPNSVKVKGNKVDVKALGNDAKVREYFATILPDFDDERVYTNDIKKVFSWYNILVGAGITEFVAAEEETATEE